MIAVANVQDLFHFRIAASRFPARHRLPRDMQLFGKGLLRHAAPFSNLLQLFAKGHFVSSVSLCDAIVQNMLRFFHQIELAFCRFPVISAQL